MKDGMRVNQQKARIIPIQLQEKEDQEIKNLLERGNNEKINNIKDDVFIQHVVITVKKNRSVKLS